MPFPTPLDLPNPGIKPESLVAPALAGRFFTTVPPGKSKANILGLRLCWVNSREVAVKENGSKGGKKEEQMEKKKKKFMTLLPDSLCLSLSHTTHTHTHTHTHS